MTTPTAGMTGLTGPNARVDGAPFCRVTVIAPAARMDVALPVDLTVAELVPMLTELAGELGRRAPARGAPAAWCLAAVAGAELPPASTLAALGVLDGDMLRLRRRADGPPPPVFDDPVDAVAETVRPSADETDVWGDHDREFDDGPLVVRPWDDRWRRAAGLIGCGTAGPLAGVLVSGLRGFGPQASPAASVIAGLAACAALAGARHTARTDAGAATALAFCAVSLAACTGFAALPGVPGAGHLLVSTALAAAVAAGGLALIGGAAPPLIAVVLAGAITAFAGSLALGVDLVTPAGAGAVAATIAVGLLPALPRLSTRLAGLPPPDVPTNPAEMFVADHQWEQADPEQIRYRSELAHAYLAGLVLGATALAGIGAIVASYSGGRLGCGFGVVVVTVLLLRSRAYATAAASVAPFGTGLLAGSVIVVELAGQAPSWARIAGALALLAVGAVGLWLVWPGRGREPSPATRRAVDVLEALLVIVLFPLALWVLDVYEFVRHLT